jgi:hypothetical protein
MFLQNKTPFKAALARGKLVDSRSIGAVVVEVVHRYAHGRLEPHEGLPAPVPTDPPDTSRHAAWQGTSVTVAGDVYGSRAASYRQLVALAAGHAEQRLTVSGDRRWTRHGAGALRASTPVPFDRLTLSFARAFGGYFDLPPGLFPGTDLPFPGGRVGYGSNEGGVGFYADEAAAAGRPLPNFELADQMIQQWNDRPVPGCFVPCSELQALRMSPPGAGRDPGSPEVILSGIFRGLHHAPGYLVFDHLAPGTPLGLDGVGTERIRFAVPPPPVRVRLRLGARTNEAPPRLRSVHLDVDRALVSWAWGYSFLYEDGKAPSWVLVEG